MGIRYAMPTSSVKTQLLDSTDLIEAAARLLARAFLSDPLILYMNRQRPVSEDFMMAWMRPIVRYGFQCGQVWLAKSSEQSADPIGVCLFLGPDRPYVSTYGMVKYGMYRLPLDWPIGNCLRAVWGTRQFSGLQKRFAPERHYYLLALGVEPEFCGKGHGRKLVAELTRRARTDDVPIYLETTHESNLAFYGRLGFRVVGEVIASEKEPKLKVWSLLWNPG